MYELALEVTNLCNRDCIHCMRNKADVKESIPLELVADLLPQARALGMKCVSLTGGEVSLYPDLPALLDLITDFGFQFSLVTNGYRFKDRLLPLLLQPKVRGKVSAVGSAWTAPGPKLMTPCGGRGPSRKCWRAPPSAR